MAPPSGVYLAALESRLYIILSNLSTSKYPEHSSVASKEIDNFFFFTKGAKAKTEFFRNKLILPQETFNFNFPFSTFLNSRICWISLIKREVLFSIT